MPGFSSRVASAKQTRYRSLMFYAIFFVFLIAVDQLTKLYFQESKSSLDFGWVRLHFVSNTGASFGLFQNINPVFIFLSIMALVAIAWHFLRLPSRMALLLLAAGVMGNLLNRVMFGYVIDFIDFGWWPVFNFADSCIVIGVVWLAVSLWLQERAKKVKEGKQRREVQMSKSR
jgi:signal peptidase II